MRPQQIPLTALALRLSLFAGAWLVIAGTEPASWLIGVPAVFAASLASWQLRPKGTKAPYPARLLAFIPFFLWSSVKGGVDVAWRVLRPRMRIAPGLYIYHLRLKGPSARVLLLNTMSLLPGTLSAELEGDRLSVHALDASDPRLLAAEIAGLERRIGALFGESLHDPLTEPTNKAI